VVDHPARWWHALPDGRIQCDLCPRSCRLRDGQRGYCFVRAREGDQLVLTTYGRSSGFALDPIEKKPLSHFYPGTTVFSFGTAGCNLGCKFCQNWSISTAHEMDRLGEQATPEQIVAAARHLDAASIAFTYNDPIIFSEYAIDIAQVARAAGIHPVAVTAGYINPEPRRELFVAMDATNIDLKAFTEDFYWRVTGAHLRDILETLVYVKHETDVWLEITTLIIPGFNDDPSELDAEFAWLVSELGPDMPLHLSAFHPAYRMQDVPPTPPKELVGIRERALGAGLQYVYTGNIYDAKGQATYCANCHRELIKRDWYRVKRNRVVTEPGSDIGYCPDCGATIPGRFQ